MKKIIFLISLFFIFSSVFSQDDNDPFYVYENIPRAPEASNLGQYGDVANNPYTGKANVAVPIYSINFEGLQIPIQLSYDTGGVKVAQEASWVGLNWSLSTNFGINRTIKGGDDLLDILINVAEGGTAKSGFVYNNYETSYNTSIGVHMDIEDVKDIHWAFGENGSGVNNTVDTEPDIFDINLFGNTYKFRLLKKQTGTNMIEALVFNDKNVKIIYDSSPNKQSFQLIDDLGFTYEFNTKNYTASFTSSYAGTVTFAILNDMLNHDKNKMDETIITSWSLDKNISPQGKELNLEYVKSTYLTHPGYSETASRIGDGTGSSDFGGFGAVTNSTSMTIIHSHYLSSISGDFGEVVFNLAPRKDLLTGSGLKNYMDEIGPSSNYYIDLVTTQGVLWHCHGTSSCSGHPGAITDTPKKLTSILVKDYNGVTKLQANFAHSYFNNQKENAFDKSWHLRLKLDQVTINDLIYSFDYLNPNGLPSKNSADVDFWGFFNGEGNTHKVPSIERFSYETVHAGGFKDVAETYYRFMGANRGSNFQNGRKGTLSKITYPTGGYSILEYEPHTAILSSPAPYLVTSEYPSGRIKETNLVDELDYKFTYQYLKYAKDPNWSFYDHRFDGVITTGDVLNIKLNEVFTIEAPSQLVLNATLQLWQFGCNMPYYQSHISRYIRDPATGQNVSTMLLYGDWPTPQGCPNPTIQFAEDQALRTFVLPPGTYVIRSEYPEHIEINGQFITPPAISVLNETINGASPYNLFLGEVSNGDLPFAEQFEIGGNRIRSITHYNNNDSFISKKIYDYTLPNATDPNFSSSGKLMDAIIHFSKAYGYQTYNPRGFSSSKFKVSSNSSITGNPSAQGNHIGYSTTTELKVNRNDEVFSSISRAYFNEPNSYLYDSFCKYFQNSCFQGADDRDVCVENAILLGVDPANSFGYINGNVVSEHLWDKAGQEVQRSSYLYTTLQLNSDTEYFSTFMPIPTTQVNLQIVPCRPEYYAPYLSDHVSYRTYQNPDYYGRKAVVNTKETINFSENGEHLTTQTFSYDINTSYLLSKEVEVYENDLIIDKFYYPNSPGSNGLPHMSTLISENQLARVVKVENFRNTTKLGTRRYNFDKSNATGNNVMVNSVLIGKGNNIEEERLKYEKYDQKGRLLQKRSSNGIPS
ncbi:MAG: hypothetical protein JKY22_00925, partial [Flavobacteriaceae bacterium]|nr:hypothetical protein [Flavobacteriaceae bacterium]